VTGACQASKVLNELNSTPVRTERLFPEWPTPECDSRAYERSSGQKRTCSFADLVGAKGNREKLIAKESLWTKPDPVTPWEWRN